MGDRSVVWSSTPARGAGNSRNLFAQVNVQRFGNSKDRRIRFKNGIFLNFKTEGFQEVCVSAGLDGPTKRPFFRKSVFTSKNLELKFQKKKKIL